MSQSSFRSWCMNFDLSLVFSFTRLSFAKASAKHSFAVLHVLMYTITYSRKVCLIELLLSKTTSTISRRCFLLAVLLVTSSRLPPVFIFNFDSMQVKLYKNQPAPSKPPPIKSPLPKAASPESSPTASLASPVTPVRRHRTSSAAVNEDLPYQLPEKHQVCSLVVVLCFRDRGLF